MKPRELECFEQVAAVIGEECAEYELALVDHMIQKEPLKESFIWGESPQKEVFWVNIDKGIDPYDRDYEKPVAKEWAFIADKKGLHKAEWYFKDGEDWECESGLFAVGDDSIKVLGTHSGINMPDWIPGSAGIELPEKTPANSDKVTVTPVASQPDSLDKAQAFLVTRQIMKENKANAPKTEAGDKDLKFDDDKIRMELLPFNALEAAAQVLTFGAKKYEADSWKELDNAEERYKGALLRHFSALHQGELLDNESGLLHAAHLACDALFLLHFELEKLATSAE